MLQSLQGVKTYLVAAAMVAYAAAAFFVFPPPYNLTLNQAAAVVAAAFTVGGFRSGLTTEVQKLLAALGVNVLDGAAKTPAQVQTQPGGPALIQIARQAVASASAKAGKVAPVFLAMIFAGSILTGCISFGGIASTPAQRVFAAKGDFDTYLILANAYGSLPTCPEQAPVCKTATVLDAVKKGAHTAKDALDAADTVVNDPAWKGTDKATAYADAAVAAVHAFFVITSDLKTK